MEWDWSANAFLAEVMAGYHNVSIIMSEQDTKSCMHTAPEVLIASWYRGGKQCKYYPAEETQMQHVCMDGERQRRIGQEITV